MEPASAARPISREDSLATRFQECRARTEALCAELEAEDFVIQAAPEASPPRWHLAHTTWFFEEFLLRGREPGFRPFHPAFGFLFNSYYETIGPFFDRPRRGTLSRPTVKEVFRYRREITERVLAALSEGKEEARGIVELGIQHEQQHQELLLTDMLLNFAANPLRPSAFRSAKAVPAAARAAARWVSFPEEICRIGFEGAGFSYDNERPAHRILRGAFELSSRLVSNGEFREFVEARGYERPELWLSEGWRIARLQGWTAPAYWEKSDGRWWQMTLHGMQPLSEDAPVCHVSYFEAEAFARWQEARLPTEEEWESVARSLPVDGNFVESGYLRPVVGSGSRLFAGLWGDVWEWTRSAYLPYPGFRPEPGSLGEYNGKFMCNQMVLRGGSCATPLSHIRPSYRNFFQPEARWQFSGFRLARDA